MDKSTKADKKQSNRNSIKEFSLRALLLGVFLGLFFAIANAYLALKLGTTVSASIPAAILSMGIFRFLRKNVTILEHNIVQTIASVGEGLASGVVFTIPALFFLGETPSIGTIFILSFLGGILGILLMIPMRRYLIVKEHKTLPFPEGTACASILKAEKKASKSSSYALWGFLIASINKIGSNLLFLWNETCSFQWNIPSFKTSFSMDTTPALLGVGYIVGPWVTLTMLSGGIVAWWVLIPIIQVFGDGNIGPMNLCISALSPDEIWHHYIRYIGAGCIAVGGLLSLGKILPLVVQSLKIGIQEIFSGFISRAHLKRTDRDISMAWLLLGTFLIALFLWTFMPLNLFTIILLLVLSFFFAGVTSFTVGLVGSTSNPVSGMTITTILLTCILFVFLGWTERLYLVSAITMGCVACCAICLSGTTSQDLKTGYILGATPYKQQIAEMVGAILPSLALGITLYLLNSTYHIGSKAMPAPQAALMSMIAEGVIHQNLPYPLFGAGILIGISLALLRTPVLSFALGLYLPLSLTTAIVVGGLVRMWVDRKTSSEIIQERGVLFSSGLIGGDACIGILVALLTLLKVIPLEKAAYFPGYVTALIYFLMALLIPKLIRRKEASSS